jgi:hypothetical protein
MTAATGTRYRTTARWAGAVALLALITACGGISDMIEEQTAELTSPTASGGGSSSDSGDRDEGDPSAFRLSSGTWENSCTVVSIDEVAAATGLTVLEEREQGVGCDWVVESVDPDIISEPIVGWQPMRALNVNAQWEASQPMASSLVLEEIEGLGTYAFWRGSGRGPGGEVWARNDQVGFRVMDQFSGPNYTGDVRASMEALAAALLDSLAGMDVLAASGDHASALIPAESVNLPEGLPTMDSLIDELSAVPLPDGAVIGFGDVYPDRASQDVYTDLAVGDAVRFYLQALPAAGFEITSGGTVETEEDVFEYISQSISFIDPDGNRGDVGIREGFFAPSQLNIQIFLR